MAKSDTPHVAILGAGPVGLEAALLARSLNLPVTVYERGRVGEHLHQWGHVRLFSPFGMNATPLGRSSLLSRSPQHAFPDDNACLTGREHLAAYLQPLADGLKDCLQTATQVLHVGRRGLLKEDGVGDAKRGQQKFLLYVRDGKKAERIDEADVVLDCTGTYGRHRWLGSGGIPALGEAAAAPQIAYGLEDVLGERKAHYANKSILVLGGGYSAATTVCNLATLAEEFPETWITWLARGAGTQPIKRVANDPLRERDRLAVRANTLATRGEGNVEFHPACHVESVTCRGADQGFVLSGRCAGKAKTWEADRVVANVGYSPDTDLYRELQIHECYATLGPMALAAALTKHAGADCLTIPATGANALRNPEPNFYILGAKSYGRNAQFLLRTGFEQVREAFALVTGKTDLVAEKKR